jgi:hypothetical protein
MARQTLFNFLCALGAMVATTALADHAAEHWQANVSSRNQEATMHWDAKSAGLGDEDPARRYSLRTIVCPTEKEPSFSAGPLYDKFPLTLSSGMREEAAGPFYNRQWVESQRLVSFPPFYARQDDTDIDSTEIDSLYPLLTYERYGAEYRWQFFQLFSFAGGKTQEEIPKKRFTLFPFYFQQRSPRPEYNYTAVLPFYGHLRDRLFRDEITFVMFPVYAQSRKKDVVTDNYVYPFFHLRHGEELHGWQFFPIVGSEHKGVTWKTNSLDELEVIGGHEKFFAVWPFYFRSKLALGTSNPEDRRTVFFFYNSLRSPNCDSTSYGWPFGYSMTDNRENK